MKDNIRWICYMSVMTGLIMSALRPAPAGSYQSVFRFLLIGGGLSGWAVLKIMAYREKKTNTQPGPVQPTGHPPEPPVDLQGNQIWMGDPAGRRRRMLLALLILALVGAGMSAVVYLSQSK